MFYPTCVTFQFTHPGKGATILKWEDGKFILVSIHAPWEGCDCAPRLCISALPCFNSRTLGRVRQLATISLPRYLLFQFTHPGKGATQPTGFLCPVRGVSIHAPWEGCDLPTICRLLHSISFNSRTLGRVRLNHYLPVAFIDRVSIHAPWEGCDSHFVPVPRLGNNVSIHAPWEGCDF